MGEVNLSPDGNQLAMLNIYVVSNDNFGFLRHRRKDNSRQGITQNKYSEHIIALLECIHSNKHAQ